MRTRAQSAKRADIFGWPHVLTRVSIPSSNSGCEMEHMESFISSNRRILPSLPPGEPSLSGSVTVHVTVTSEATPVFSWSQYRVVTPENVPLHTAIASLEAHSPASHKLIYSIVAGNVYDEFTIDFNIGL